MSRLLRAFSSSIVLLPGIAFLAALPSCDTFTTCEESRTCAPGARKPGKSESATPIAMGGAGGEINSSASGGVAMGGTVSVPEGGSGPTKEELCQPGTSVVEGGCAPCPSSTYSTEINAKECAPWTECASGFVEGSPGSATSDRTCKLFEYKRQFGTASAEKVTGLAVDSKSVAYVAYDTHPTYTQYDGHIARRAPNGEKQLDDLVFSNGSEVHVNGLFVDASDYLYVVGSSLGYFTGTAKGGTDGWVRKYSPAGEMVWERQFGSSADDSATGVVVDAEGNVFIVGECDGSFSSQTHAGGSDAFVIKYSASGTPLWVKLFGTNGNDYGKAVALTSSGDVLVAGYTAKTLPGAVAVGGADGFVRSYSTSGSILFTTQFGSTTNDFVYDLVVRSDDSFAIAGRTTGAVSATNAGLGDALVVGFDKSGNSKWAHQFGTVGEDYAYALALDSDENFFVAGSVMGALPGYSLSGSTDAFERTLTSAGEFVSGSQWGTSGADSIKALGYDAQGALLLAGVTSGFIGDGQLALGGDDAFLIRRLP